MPPNGKEVLISDLEAEVLSVFVKRKILDDTAISALLQALINKLVPKEG